MHDVKPANAPLLRRVRSIVLKYRICIVRSECVPDERVEVGVVGAYLEIGELAPKSSSLPKH